MEPKSDTWLTLEEFKSLKEISKAPQRKSSAGTPQATYTTRARAPKSDGLVVTDAGSVTIAYWTSGRRSPPGA